MNNPNIKKFEIGDAVLLDRGRDKIHILDIREYEGCVILIYKTWNRYKRIWDYAGQKFTEILYKIKNTENHVVFSGVDESVCSLII